MKSFQLLSEKRFGPFFWTQFLGAFNDNVFKNALVILLAYRAATEAEGGLWINLASGLFILPFFLFSPIAGQLADKFDKAKIAQWVKISEILFMVLGALAFYVHSREFLVFVLFLMGIHSTFFGPIKYSILPQTLRPNELVAGNAMVELGTFLAILLGTILGGYVISEHPDWIAFFIIGIAVIGYFVSRRMPDCPSGDPNLKIRWNFFGEIREMWSLARKERSVHLSVLGISWFWFYGAVFLSQIPNFTKYFIGGKESVVTLFLATFSLSIGLGSLLCEKLSNEEIELGLVPLGAFGMSLFALDLYFIEYLPAAELMNFAGYLIDQASFSHYRVLFDLAMIGVFGSFYTLPLYALIQKRSSPQHRSRIIAWLNIMNSIFIVLSALVAMVMYKLGLNTVQIFLVCAVLNFAVGTYIFFLIPEFLFRFVVWLLAITIYRIRFEGREKFPAEGAVLIVANHISFIDWLVVTAACRRPARFVMDHRFFFIPVIKWFFQLSKAIPIAPAKEDPTVKERAFVEISRELRDGQVVCIFPEGLITHSGELNPFKPGVEKILGLDPVPVVPVSIHGLWGSFFSRHRGRAMTGVPKPTRRKVIVKVGDVMSPKSSALDFENTVRKMLAESVAQA